MLWLPSYKKRHLYHQYPTTHLPQVRVPGREDSSEGSRLLTLVDTDDHCCVQRTFRWVRLDVVLCIVKRKGNVRGTLKSRICQWRRMRLDIGREINFYIFFNDSNTVFRRHPCTEDHSRPDLPPPWQRPSPSPGRLSLGQPIHRPHHQSPAPSHHLHSSPAMWEVRHVS